MHKNTDHTYEVKAIEPAELRHKVWNTLPVLDDFRQPWSNKPMQETQFRAYHDNQWLFLKYDVKDEAVRIHKVTGEKIEVAYGSRVEIFFKTDELLKRYYCLEVDPEARILDYTAAFYRDFDYEWSWPEGHLFAEARTTDLGYCVQLKISLESLRGLDILKNGAIGAGIYRGDCTKLGNLPETEPEFTWITWVDPKTHEPDFHVPSSFGTLKMNNL